MKSQGCDPKVSVVLVRVPIKRDRTSDNGETPTFSAINGAGDAVTAGTASIDNFIFNGFRAWRVNVGWHQGFWPEECWSSRMLC